MSIVQKSVRRFISAQASFKAQHPQEWLVVLPDNAGVLDRRIKIRPQHSPNFVALHNKGWVSWAGPMFEYVCDKSHPRRPFRGSIMVVHETCPEQIFQVLSKDIYVKENIWNLGETKVCQFRTFKRVQV